MKKLDIVEREIFRGLEINQEVIKPVAEKWDDGFIYKTDNLQITIRSISNRKIKDACAYLYYYDSTGKELGHEFDITDEIISPLHEARFSLMLLPPEGVSKAKLEIKAQYEERFNYIWGVGCAMACVSLVYIYEFFWGV